jgi:hypothetical protein
MFDVPANPQPHAHPLYRLTELAMPMQSLHCTPVKLQVITAFLREAGSLPVSQNLPQLTGTLAWVNHLESRLTGKHIGYHTDLRLRTIICACDRRIRFEPNQEKAVTNDNRLFQHSTDTASTNSEVRPDKLY